MQFAKVGYVQGQQVVLDDAPELRLIPVHDRIVRIEDEFVTARRFAVLHVGAAVLLDDVCGNPHTYAAIDFSPPIAVQFVVGLLVHEFIAEELGRLADGMGYESLFPGHFEFEAIA